MRLTIRKGAGLICLAAAVLLGGGARPAAAQTVGYTVQITNEGTATIDAPSFRVTNNSTTHAITRFEVTIGDTAYNFDRAFEESGDPGVTATLLMPDTGHGLERDDNVAYIDFSGFDPGKMFRFRGEIDRDDPLDPNQATDFRQVLFNNGAAENSVITVFFSSGQSLSLTLPESPAHDPGNSGTYTFSQSAPVTAVPEPASALLFLPGLAVVGLLKRRKGEPADA